jgi:hypothetical protein
MKRAIIVIFGLILLVSCTERLICPAYQSAYIYDKDELRKKFSYFLDDSTPKVYTASKNKYLVAEPMSYRARVRSLQTVKMKPVPVVVPDSISNPGADSVSMEDMRKATQSVIDSTYIVDIPRDTANTAPKEDSIYVITKDKELRLLKYNSSDSLDYDSIQQRYVKQKPQYYISDVRYNLEQDHYMWYLRDQLILPDVKLARSQQGEEGGGGKNVKEKQGLKGFFKNLFKKKKKAEVDSSRLVQPPKEEYDYVDTLSQAEVPQPGQIVEQDEPKPDKPKKDGGLFKKKKKSVKPPKKDAKKPEEELPDEKKKKEEEDDGF